MTRPRLFAVTRTLATSTESGAPTPSSSLSGRVTRVGIGTRSRQMVRFIITVHSIGACSRSWVILPGSESLSITLQFTA